MRNTAIATAVVDSIAQLTGRSAHKISNTDNLVDDLGIDSLTATKLFSRIEGTLGIALPEGSEGSLVGIDTVGELIDRLGTLLNSAANPG